MADRLSSTTSSRGTDRHGTVRRVAVRRPVDPVWTLGFRYFLAYIPYALLIKSLTSGLVPGVPAVQGYAILPLAAAATWVMMVLIVWRLGWWNRVEWRTVLGLSIPVVRPASFISGLCTAVIVGTTTLAFSLPGVSIVLVLVAMRGGVLVIARLADLARGRRIGWDAMAAFMLTLAAIAVAFSSVTDYTLTATAIGTIGLYLLGYVVRFHVIDRLGKSEDRQDAVRYFVEEQAVAMPTLLVLTLLIPAVGSGEVADGLLAGLIAIPSPLAAALFLAVGLMYATLYVFGTQIYLHRREHTFCVPINRACSILSGVVASFVMVLLFDRPVPSATELAGAGLLVLALAVLVVTAMVQESRKVPVRRLFLFVCSGNTARSPMAQAICTAEISARLGLTIPELAAEGIEVLSAGIAARTGKPMKPEAIAALETIGVPPHEHVATPLTPELIAQAEAVYCMTDAQRLAVVEMLPEAADRVHCLDASGDMEEPVGLEDMLTFARSAREHLRARLGEVMPSPQFS